MGSLAHCLKANGFGPVEERSIRERAAALREEGHTAQSASEQAAKDLLAELVQKRSAIEAQLQDMIPAKRGKASEHRTPQTSTLQFKTWFGDSKIVDADGSPLRLYHGTPHEFDAFAPSLFERSGDMGGGIYMTNTPADASSNYAGVGADLENKIDERTDALMEERNITPAGETLYDWHSPEYNKMRAAIRREVKKKLSPTKGIMLPLFVRMEKPFYVGGPNETVLTVEYVEDENGDIIDEQGSLVDFVMALQNVGDELGIDLGGVFGEVMGEAGDVIKASALIGILKMKEQIIYVEDEEGKIEFAGEIIRRALEKAGYDGIVDSTVNRKWGSQHAGFKMPGMHPGTAHYIAFHPTQVKSASGNSGEFSNRSWKLNEHRRPSPATWDAPAITSPKWENVVFQLQDKHIDTKKVMKAIEDFRGAPLPDAQNAYLQEELFHGKAAKASEDFINRELKPLVVDMGARGVQLGEFETYLHNRHAEERNKQIAKVNPAMPDAGSGIKTADAQAYLAGLPAAKRAAYTALARRVDAIIARTNQILVAGNLESQKTVNAWNGTYKHYVPLHREDMGDGNLGGTGQGYSTKGPASKRATGSLLAVENILANLALAREKTITRAAKNAVATSLVNAALANRNAAFWDVDTPPVIKYIGPNGLVVEAVDPMWKSRDNVVVARMLNSSGDVVEHGVVFNKRNERAVRMAQALKNLDSPELTYALAGMAKITRYFSAINTQYNPIFGAVNLTRDVQQAAFSLTTTPIAGKQATVLARVIPALVGVFRDVRAQRKGRPARSAWGRTYEEFQKAGGETGYRDLFITPSDRSKAIEKELQHMSRGLVMRTIPATIKWLGDMLSDYNTAMENSTRLAAYKTARDAGLSQDKAASLAKNLTVNFNRKGNVSTQVGSLYAFFNASAQGTARLYETLAGPKGKQIIAGGILLGVLQAMMLAAAGFDDDEPPEFVRERNLIIPIGGKKFLTIPLPLGLNFLPNLGRIPTELVLNGGRDATDKLLNLAALAFDAFSPIGGGASVAQIASPTVFDPAVALLENKDWTGKPISREDMNPLDPTPGHVRAKEVASGTGRWVSEAINELTGGTEFVPGRLSPTPDAVDYVVGQVTGGVGREALKVGATARAMATGEELPAHKIPLLGRIYGEATGQAKEGAAFYRNVIEINRHERELKGRAAVDGDVDGYLEKNPVAELVKQGNAAEREVAKLRKQRRELVKSAAPKSEVQEIEAEITDAMKAFNDLVKETRQP